MLAILGCLTIAALLAAILTKRLTPLSALIAIPVASALAGGFGLKTAAFMVHGIQSVSAVAGMFIFAILYFGIVTDAGMLDPIVDRLLRAVGSDPPRIAMGTALLALLVHLDG
jgi:citrate-Mg2+:H+ or citrate-Ca2+:H+ symporter, CitMHS family